MVNLIATLVGIIICIIGMGPLIYPPLAHLINIPGDDRLKALAALIIGIIIIVYALYL
jgi:choline-glycine betaine transporter